MDQESNVYSCKANGEGDAERSSNISLGIIRSPLLGESDVQDEDLPLHLGVELGEDGLQLGHGKEGLVGRDERQVMRDANPVEKDPETPLSSQFSRQALKKGE